LIYSDVNGSDPLPHFDHAKVMGAVNYAAIFPRCGAVVHHGGAGTTAAGMRAGIPSLILWTEHDQPIWGATVERLKVGSARHFSAVTQESLVADLRSILAPQYVMRAKEIASQMTKSAESVGRTAALLEDAVRRARSG
jgi:UDP:flavonoid glycosyltransferase YjiC (YdhE family)